MQDDVGTTIRISRCEHDLGGVCSIVVVMGGQCAGGVNLVCSVAAFSRSNRPTPRDIRSMQLDVSDFAVLVLVFASILKYQANIPLCGEESS